MMKPKILFIDPWKSECGDCGANVNPMAMGCEPLDGKPGCNHDLYEIVSSHYANMEDHVAPMRPDLHWDPMWG